ncbi:unnamed protein product [Dibothriocephalus latus]|uniref:Uncharacterized protein n=1 Tax=Dibothriocephalus latus TaxID=60516 RepID=A0A3P7P4L0_DIBLA|nr:unnamed protein product [Dibothriocephalus latus]
MSYLMREFEYEPEILGFRCIPLTYLKRKERAYAQKHPFFGQSHGTQRRKKAGQGKTTQRIKETDLRALCGAHGFIVGLWPGLLPFPDLLAVAEVTGGKWMPKEETIATRTGGDKEDATWIDFRLVPEDNARV